MFETKNLILRKLVPTDAAFIFKLLNDPSFIRNIGDRGIRTLADAEQYITKGAIVSYEQNGFGLYGVELKSTSEPLGICGLVKRPELIEPDIGFALMPPFWRKGYAYESAVEVLNFAKENLKLARVAGITSLDNLGSIKLLEKLGLKFEAIVKLHPNKDPVKKFMITFEP